MLNKRTAGRTGFELTEYGLGAWALGGVKYGSMDQETAKGICRRYVEIGGNFIDTARIYGESEHVVGSFLKESGNRSDFFISSKTPAGESTETLPNIRKDLETSLRELRTDYIDIYFLHHPPEEPAVLEEALGIFERLKEEGKIRAIGASIKGANVTAGTEALCDQYIETNKVDVIQLVYSILRQRLRGVIERALRNGVAIVARTTLESGLLAGRYQPGHRFEGGDHRTRYAPENLDFILQKVQELKERVGDTPYSTLPHLALNFPRSLPGVTTSIIGATSLSQVEDTARALQLPPLDAELQETLKSEYGNLTARANFR